MTPHVSICGCHGNQENTNCNCMLIFPAKLSSNHIPTHMHVNEYDFP